MIRAQNISHYYGSDTALEGINLEIQRGEFVALFGESGSGKSTLLSILSTLLTPSSGSVEYDAPITNLDTFRRGQVGFIFQFHYLLNYLTIRENIALAAREPARIDPLLATLGIDDIADKYPDAISGGQRQRGAIARAVVNRPKYIFADEPTGNLDSKNGKIVFDFLKNMSLEGSTVVVATHTKEILPYCDREIHLGDGKIV